MPKNIPIKTLEDRLKEKDHQIQIFQAEAALLRSMIDEALGRKPVAEPKPRARRSNVKDTVLAMLQDVKAVGLNAALAVEMAEKERGVTLDRGTVSGLLSRLKGEGVLAYDGRVYRLKDFASTEPPAADNVIAHPASKVQS